MIKVTYIISDINKALAFEWTAQYIDKKRFHLSFILLNPGQSDLFEHLLTSGFEVISIPCNGKKDWPLVLWRVFKIFKQLKPDIVHCHLIQANIIGLFASRLAGIKKRIYTRHHSSLHHKYFPKGVWWDKLSNKLATHIVAVSKTVQNILIDWEKADAHKVKLIPHGFLLESFAEVNRERVLAFKRRNDINESQFVIGVISRLTEWKGVQYIVPAFKTFFQRHPNTILVLLNAQGDYEKEIKQLLKAIPEANYRLITFEDDIAAAYKAMNVFIHVPIDEHSEAFGQIYVEALAASIPSIFTLSGIAADFIREGCNAFVVPFRDSAAIYKQLKKISTDYENAKSVAYQGTKDVQQRFSLDKMIKSLENLYDS
ncbi:glycosyltransferase [Flavisolibacter tropicus]|uniref:Glycosyl transferase family 1 n=1 Tax=Flavisolibacter tropicus TaxID=1492898 RepID=A0A172TZP4_9BACT|nr:glycosyltransferase [Flavisolibacter tropicus]ANE52452.1 hypothetical protein SY85_20175 [Flavisolibacter tropicus]